MSRRKKNRQWVKVWTIWCMHRCTSVYFLPFTIECWDRHQMAPHHLWSANLVLSNENNFFVHVTLKHVLQEFQPVFLHNSLNMFDMTMTFFHSVYAVLDRAWKQQWPCWVKQSQSCHTLLPTKEQLQERVVSISGQFSIQGVPYPSPNWLTSAIHQLKTYGTPCRLHWMVNCWLG